MIKMALADRSALPKGLAYASMTGEQRAQLLRLVRHYAERPAEEVAVIEWRRLEQAGFDEIRFAWLGPEERDRGHYYAITGPTFMVEYDNVQNGANHLHTLWRDAPCERLGRALPAVPGASVARGAVGG